jgi:hypothetical protein
MLVVFVYNRCIQHHPTVPSVFGDVDSSNGKEWASLFGLLEFHLHRLRLHRVKHRSSSLEIRSTTFFVVTVRLYLIGAFAIIVASVQAHYVCDLQRLLCNYDVIVYT